GAPARHAPPRSHGTKTCPEGTRTCRASAPPTLAAPPRCRSVPALPRHVSRAALRQQVPCALPPVETGVVARCDASLATAAWPALAAGPARSPPLAVPVLFAPSPEWENRRRRDRRGGGP